MGFPYPYPLGLPKGSVRATITMALSINLIVLTFYNSDYATYVSTMAAVSITFYFGGRMRSGKAIIPRDAPSSQRAWGLPAGTIRTMLFLLFVGTAGYLFYNSNYDFSSVPSYLFDIMNIIIGYVIGRSFNKIRNKVIKKKDEEGNASQATIFDHLKALVVLAIVAYSIYMTHIGLNQEVVTIILIANILLGFYFGERD